MVNYYLLNLSFKFHKDLCINVCCKLYLDPFLRHFGWYLGTCFSKPIHEFKLWTQFIWSLKINEYIIFLLKLEGLSKRKIFPGTILLLTASCIFLVKAFTLQSCNIKNVYKSFLLSCCVALFFFTCCIAQIEHWTCQCISLEKVTSEFAVNWVHWTIMANIIISIEKVKVLIV